MGSVGSVRSGRDSDRFGFILTTRVPIERDAGALDCRRDRFGESHTTGLVDEEPAGTDQFVRLRKAPFFEVHDLERAIIDARTHDLSDRTPGANRGPGPDDPFAQ